MIRVLMISKATVTASYRSKLAYLNRLDPDVSVGLVTPPRWGGLPFEPDPADDGYPLFIRPVWLSGRNHFHRYPGLARLVRAFRPDLLHVDEEHYSWVTAEAVGLAHRMGIPALFFTWQNLYKRYPWPFSVLERRVLGSAAAAIAGNGEAAQVLRQKGFTRPIAVIPQFGYDPARFYPHPAPEVRGRLGWPEGLAVGYVGRLVPEKGLDDLADALIPILQENPNVTLALVGQGPWEAVGRARLARAGVQARVRFVPWLPSAELPALMNALDVLVLPSRTTPRWKEQFGRVLVEAMACGVAVVGSASGEIPRVIGEAGLVVPEGRPDLLEAAVRRLLAEDDLRRALGQKGLERARAHFSQEAVARATLEVYRKTVAGRAGQDGAVVGGSRSQGA